jgi:hypothetical protein
LQITAGYNRLNTPTENHAIDDYVRSKSGPKNKKQFEVVDDDDTNSEICRNDILKSSLNNDEEEEGGVTFAKTP